MARHPISSHEEIGKKCDFNVWKLQALPHYPLLSRSWTASLRKFFWIPLNFSKFLHFERKFPPESRNPMRHLLMMDAFGLSSKKGASSVDCRFWEEEHFLHSITFSLPFKFIHWNSDAVKNAMKLKTHQSHIATRLPGSKWTLMDRGT